MKELQKTEAQSEREDFKEFEEMAKSVFDYFEELTGKSVNRSMMIQNLAHYFNENFSEDEMKDYVLDSQKDLYFQEHSEKFTIANLFPIRDQDRINMAWDKLAHFQALRLKPKKVMKGVMMLLKCGTKVPLNDKEAYEAHNAECFKNKGKCFYP